MKISKKHQIELIKLYKIGKSPADLSKIYPYKRTTIKELMRRKGVVRSQSEAAKLAAKQGKKDKALKELIKIAKTTNRFNPNKIHYGEDNPGYLEVGSIVNTHNGKYKKIKIADNKWKYEHIYLIEKKLYRKLKPNEVVHHIDFNGKNNDLDNLIVLDKKEHWRLHTIELNKLIKELFNKGIIIFNRKLKKYVSIY